LLVIREEQVARELHLVRMRSVGDGDLPHDARAPRVGDIDDAGAHAEVAHVPDVDDVAVPHDLHAVAPAVKIGVPNKLEAARLERAR
jgi:hypothetical protein